MAANFNGSIGAEEGAIRNEQHWLNSFAAQRQWLLEQPDDGVQGINKNAPSFHKLIKLLDKEKSA